MKKGLSLQKKYQIAKKAEDKVLEYKKIASISFLFIGKELKRIKEDKLYRYLGTDSPEFESFENYVNSPTINIDLRKAYYLIQIWITFCEKYKYKPEELSGIYWTALRAILPVVNENNVSDLIEKAKTLTRTHLEQEVKQLKSGLTSMEDLEKHAHTWKFISYYRCTVCGEKSIVKPKDGKIIK